ncbi:hypothetical protein [Natrinema sp. DC36]|uniref:hypothetical protein n=1 Tax=Natrinema sp. DC36 TaxID=2878680 RepID=UPI001CEFFAFA|nr:hypothetical protein [Natrinema sp. DC36]
MDFQEADVTVTIDGDAILSDVVEAECLLGRCRSTKAILEVEVITRSGALSSGWEIRVDIVKEFVECSQDLEVGLGCGRRVVTAGSRLDNGLLVLVV